MNKKISITITIIIILFGIIILFVLLNKHSKENEKKEDFYLVLDNYSTWEYHRTWRKVYVDTIENKKLSVYVNNAVLGDYTLVYGTNWNLFNEYNDYVNYNGKLLAISPNKKVGFINYTKDTLNYDDIEVIKELTKNDNINLQKISPYEKVITDLDNNGENDTIVIASNKDIQNQNKYFNLIYVELNGKITSLINDEIEYYYKKSAPTYSLDNILLFESDTHGSIVIHKTYFSEISKPGNIMFGFVDKKYQLLIED